MNELLKLIEMVRRADTDPQISRASRIFAHILLDDAAEMMRTRVMLIASNLLMEEPENDGKKIEIPGSL